MYVIANLNTRNPLPIVTVKEHSAESPLALSCAVHMTVVGPIAKVEPDAGMQLINGSKRKFIGVGADQVTNVDIWEISAGHVSDGVPWSFVANEYKKEEKCYLVLKLNTIINYTNKDTLMANFKYNNIHIECKIHIMHDLNN